MSTLTTSLRRDSARLAVAVVGLGLAELLVRWSSTRDVSLPIAVLLLPVLALALVAEGPATAVVAILAVALGFAEFSYGDWAALDLRLRMGTLVVGCGLAVALATARSNRELALRRQAVRLESVRARASTEEILQAMVRRLPELTAAGDVESAIGRACELARDLFGADTVSYWHVDGDDTVLWARVPDTEAFEAGARRPSAVIAGDGNPALELSRTVWARRSEVTDTARAELMRRADAAAGTATPVMLGGRTIGYLTMSWAVDREEPDPFWLGALDRFADQVALAKSVIQRRSAQDEAQALARRFQAGMLPDLPQDGEVDVRALYRPGLSQMLLGGDFLDARVDDHGRVAFILGDVAGHGPEQAALGATLRGAWRGLSCVPELDVADWARSLDAVLRESVDRDICLFATAVMGRLDPRDRSFAFVSAGHPPPFVLATPPYTAPLGDLPLGLGDDPKFTMHTLALQDARGVLVVTDGIFEGRRAPGGGQRFDHESFLELLLERGLDDLDGPTFLNDVADEMERHNGAALPDDAAALLLMFGPR